MSVPDEGTAADLGADESFLFEQSDGVDDGGPADAVAFDELSDGGDFLAGLPVSAGDLKPQCVGDACGGLTWGGGHGRGLS